MQVSPELEEFEVSYSDGRPQVVWTKVVADLETPVSAMLKLAAGKPNAFLLESVESGANRGRYRNQEFDRTVDEGARRTKPEERRPFYLRAQEIMATDLPYISLFNRVNFAVMPAQLEGYQNYPSSELYSLKNVRWRR